MKLIKEGFRPFVAFENEEQAKEVFNTFITYPEKYGKATLGDLYDLCEAPTSYLDFQVGWADLSGSFIESVNHSRHVGIYLPIATEPIRQ